MMNKLPEKYENNFFVRIKRFFSYTFRKNSDSIENKEKVAIQENKVEINSNENKFAEMKKLSRRVELKEEIFTLVENNLQLIDTFSVERLEQLNRMYDERIEENDRKLQKLRRKNS